MSRNVQIVGNLETHHDRWLVSKKLADAGARRIAILTREITLECSEDEIPSLKKALKSLEIEGIKIKESSFLETTVSRRGVGSDAKKSVEVILMPASRMIGRRMLSVLFSEHFKKTTHKDIEKLMARCSTVTGDVLRNAGITDALFIVKISKKLKPDVLEGALEIATLNALSDGDGMVGLN